MSCAPPHVDVYNVLLGVCVYVHHTNFHTVKTVIYVCSSHMGSALSSLGNSVQYNNSSYNDYSYNNYGTTEYRNLTWSETAENVGVLA